jgi:hypothetical protein
VKQKTTITIDKTTLVEHNIAIAKNTS